MRRQAPAKPDELEAGVVYAPADSSYTEGNVAYAHRQAARLTTLADLFSKEWEDVEDIISMGKMAAARDLPRDEEGEGEGEGEGER
jgi:hypothetical protein